MPHQLRLAEGQPQEKYDDLKSKVDNNRASKRDRSLFAEINRVLSYLKLDPNYHRLKTHEIADLSRKHSRKIYCSYVEEEIPKAYRMLWAFGPGKEEISVLWIGPHPPKGRGYSRVKLAGYPEPDNED